MVFRRKFKRSTKRRFPRRYRRRTYKKKGVQKVHFFKRVKVDEIAVSKASAFNPIYSDVAGTDYNTFNLAQLPNYTEFTALFDQYKICGIKQKYVFSRNSAEVGGSVELPNLVTVNDWNDTSALADEAEALQYASYKSKRLDYPISRFFRPTMAVGQEIKKAQWLRATNTSETHYGIKQAYTIADTAAAGLGSMKIYTTFYIACRTPK